MSSGLDELKELEDRRSRIKFSVPMKPTELEAAFERGMLRKRELEDGVYYHGYSRQATVAMWSAGRHCFIYMRQKFGHRYPDRINHPEDDNGFDLFVPLVKTVPNEDEIVRE